MSKSIAVLLPFYKAVHPQTAFCITALFDHSRMKMFMNYGDAFVAHARNELARRFLNSECEWSMWFDDDVVMPIGNASWYNRTTNFGFMDKFAGLHTIDRLMSHGKTIVGGLYFGRTPTGKPMYAEGMANRVEEIAARRGPQDVVKPTKWVATGCLLVHRSVYEDISKRWPHLDDQWFSSSEHDVISAVDEALKILHTGPANFATEAQIKSAIEVLGHGRNLSSKYSRTGCGEDVQFCQRALQVGHQPHVDLGLVCGHVGSACYGPFNTRVA
jgi:hypothetical protein